MALPKLNTPEYELELPSTGGKVKFRPFLVKEQKLLMMAQESKNEGEISNSISNIIHACTNGVVDAKTSPLFDVEYVFLQLRAKSVGETADIQVLCPDDKKTKVEVKVKLDDVAVQMTEDHTNVVEITDKIKMVMKYPVLNDMKSLNKNTTDMETIFELLHNCVAEIHDGDKIHNRIDMDKKEINEFVDSLNTAQFESLMNFFKTMPKLRHAISITNPKTKKKNEVILEGLDSFLV
tara:strand:- start:186 stop:893 length:708 start_codon:yes stop_codon:yes gene_type:complete